MPLVERKRWSADEEDAAVVLFDPLLFALCFWSDDLTIPDDRLDLPALWRGRHIVSKEQRLMFEDGADYMLLRDAMPEVAAKSASLVLARTSRKVAKTVSFETRIVQIALTKTRTGIQEGMVHAPGEPHLTPVINRVNRRIEATPFFKVMLRNFDRTEGIMNWRTGFTWHWRIEGLARQQEHVGRSQVGLRAAFILGDEGDFSLEPSYNQREQCALPECFQFWGGVPRGVRGVFWAQANKRPPRWSVHRMDMRGNPIFHSDPAWEKVIAGDSYQSQRVQTQVLGLDGEEAVSSFPVIAVDALVPYTQKTFGIAEYKANQDRLQEFLGLPRSLPDADAWLMVADYGFAPSPMQLGLAYLRGGAWHLTARFEILQLDPTTTAHFMWLLDTLILPRPASLLVMDAHGQGRGVLSALKVEPRYLDSLYEERAVDVGFSGQTGLPDILVHKKCGARVTVHERDGYWKCDTCHQEIFDRAELKEAALQTKVYLTDELKNAFVRGQEWLDSGRATYPGGVAIILGYDNAAIAELRGTTEIQRAGSGVRYIPPVEGQDHITDMIRCLVSGALRFAQLEQGEGAPAPFGDFGWMGVGEPGVRAWRAPWEGG